MPPDPPLVAPPEPVLLLGLPLGAPRDGRFFTRPPIGPVVPEPEPEVDPDPVPIVGTASGVPRLRGVCNGAEPPCCRSAWVTASRWATTGWSLLRCAALMPASARSTSVA